MHKQADLPLIEQRRVSFFLNESCVNRQMEANHRILKAKVGLNSGEPRGK